MRAAEFGDSSGTAQASEPKPGLLHYVVTGRLTTSLAEQIIAFADGSRSESLWFFHDWWQVDGYDTQARYLITRWSVKHRARLRGGHILTRSKIVRMGVAVGNIAIGGIAELHDSPASFRLALSKATAE